MSHPWFLQLFHWTFVQDGLKPRRNGWAPFKWGCCVPGGPPAILPTSGCSLGRLYCTRSSQQRHQCSSCWRGRKCFVQNLRICFLYIQHGLHHRAHEDVQGGSGGRFAEELVEHLLGVSLTGKWLVWGGGWVVRDREEIRLGNIKSLLGNRQLT